MMRSESYSYSPNAEWYELPDDYDYVGTCYKCGRSVLVDDAVRGSAHTLMVLHVECLDSDLRELYRDSQDDERWGRLE